MGTLLEDEGHDVSTPLWGSAPLLSPQGRERVIGLHRAYVEAGADVIIANTHNAGEAYVRRWWADPEGQEIAAALGVRSPEALLRHVNAAAVDAARAAAPRFVAACLASPDIPYTRKATLSPDEVAAGLRLQLDALRSEAPDLIIFEMCTTVSDLEGVARAWTGAGASGAGVGLGVGLVFGADGRLRDGTEAAEAVARLRPAQPDVLFVQCTPYPEVSAALEALRGEANTRLLGAYANDGRGYSEQGWEGERVDPEAYARCAEAWWRDHGARIVGGCCGTTPDHIRAVAERIRGP